MEALHAIPVLYGCIISVTGIGVEERQRLSQLITRNGGIFTADLHTGCTHLIVAPTVIGLSRRASPKLSYARKWGLPTVSPDWLYESLSKRTCLEVNTFQVEPEQPASLPHSTTSQQTLQYTQNFLYDDLSVDEVGAVPLPPYLEGTHVFVGDQQPAERLALIKKLILAAGGTRHADLYDPSLITHYLVHNQTLTGKDLELLRQFEGQHCRPVLVHDQWLFACFHAKERVPVAPFLVPDLKKDSEGRTMSDKGETGEAIISGETMLPATLPRTSMWSLKSSTAQPHIRTPTHGHGNSQIATILSTTMNSTSVASPRPSDAPSFHLPVLAGITFRLFAFSAISMAQVTDLIEKNGGTIVNSSVLNERNADYTIAPMIVDGPLEARISPILNELWLETCIAQGRLLDPLSAPYFDAIITDDPCAGFSQLCVSLTGYAGLEREYLSKLVTALGATYTESLSRQNNLLLAASDQPGPKYDFARKMGLAIVKSSWLMNSARAGRHLSLDPYLWTRKRKAEDKHDHADDKCKAKHNEEDEINRQKEREKGQGNEEGAGEREEGEGEGRGGEEENWPRSKDRITCENSPNREASTPLSPFSTTSKKRIGPSSLELETPIRMEVVKRLKQVAAAATPTGLTQDDQVGSPGSLADGPPDISRLLSGLILSISQRLWHRREEIHDLVTEMGGTFVWSYDVSCTHYIHQGNVLEESFREFRMVRQAGKWIVSPFWLLHCKEAGRKFPESNYPHTFNSMDRERNGGGDPSSLCLTVTPTNILPELQSPPNADYTLDDFKEAIDVATNNTRFLKKGAITYSHVPLPPRPSSVIAGMMSTGNPVISFSALSGSLRGSLPASLSAAALPSVTVYGTTPAWEPSTTHLLIGTLSKSEKFLCACAAGVWVVHPEWGEVAIREGKLPAERPYEWHPTNLSSVPSTSGTVALERLARAPRYWRERRVRTGLGAFAGWCVLLLADQRRLPSLRAILKAGGATVYLVTDEQQMMEAPITHVLTSSSQMRAKIPTPVQDRLVDKFHSVDLIAEHLVDFDR